MANCNIVRYLSALICIQLFSLTNLYIISISPPVDVDNNGGSEANKNKNDRTTAISPAAQEQVMRDKGKTIEQIIAERDLIQAKLNQARRQNMLKDRKLRSLERGETTTTAGSGTSTESNNNNNKNTSTTESSLAQIREQLDELQKKHDDKDQKLRLAKDELKSTYSNFLLHVPATGGNHNNNNNNNNNAAAAGGADSSTTSLYDSSDHAPLLHKLQEHRMQLKSALTKYRVCHHTSSSTTGNLLDGSNADEDENKDESNNKNQDPSETDRTAKQPTIRGAVTVDDVVDTWEGCWLHTMEKSAFSFKLARRFVVVRNPLNHLPSLYEHCQQQQQQQQQNNAKTILLPATLDEWLDDEERQGEDAIELQDSNSNNDATIVDECEQAHAPANPQARRVLHGLPPGLDDEFALQNLYDTVGLTDELSKTACLISISIHRRVPPQCDCTATATDDDGTDNNNNNNDDDDDDDSTTTNNNGDPSFLDFDEPPVVLTERQRQAIAARTARDQRLYDVATRLFWDQVERVERVHSFRMC